MENTKLRKQIKEQEVETVKAMKSIEKRIEEETDQALKDIEKQIEKETNLKLEQTKTELSALEKQYQKKLKDLKDEKDKILEDMVKLQSESSVAKEKEESNEKKEKIKRNLKLFNSLVDKENPSVNKDECVVSVSCEGNCDNVNQLQRLNSLKQLGSSRSCPQTNADSKPMLKCDKCDFITQNKEYFATHIKGHNEKKIRNI